MKILRFSFVNLNAQELIDLFLFVENFLVVLRRTL